jgi:iron complex transport system permease protein
MSFHARDQRKPLTVGRLAGIVGLLTTMMLIVVIIGLSLGSVGVPLSHVFGALIGSDAVPGSDRMIIIALRLPRVVLAVIVGAGLSVAGLVFQALLRNPLAEPYILGISSGGTVGALVALSLSVGTSLVTTPVASFLGSAAVMAMVYALAHRRGQLDTYTLLLSGVMIGAFFNAAVLLIIAVSNQEMRNAFLWLMGNLSNARMESIALIGPAVAITSIYLLLNAKAYNLIATGEESAMQLGINVTMLKRLSYLAGSLITGLVVSVSGVVGFVGLIIPHICRMLFGPDHRVLLPASLLVGASFMVVADLLARVVLSPAEIPVGAVTAAIGAPLFVYLLKRT